MQSQGKAAKIHSYFRANSRAAYVRCLPGVHRWGSWVPADKVDEEMTDAEVKPKPADAPRVKKEPAEESLVRERRVGVGECSFCTMIRG